jgi:tetratricopeptide (TPR) repeat protein/SAM-dependent methyltransferase
MNIATRNIDRLFAQAVQHHQAGQLRDADSLYRHILAVEPKHVSSLYNAGLIGVQIGRPDVAADMIGKAVALNDCMPDWHYNLALALQALGRASAAIAHYKQATALKPDHVQAHMNLGNLLREQGKPDEAMTCYGRVTALDPRSVQAHYNRANVLAEQNKWNEAAAAYERALKLQPDFPEACNNLGIVLAALGDNDAAVCRYRTAIALRPNLAEAYVNLGKALAEMGYLDEAIAQYRQAIALKPDHVRVRNNLGVALMNQGKLEEAIEAFGSALARMPGLAEAHNNLGIALFAIGRSDEARLSYRRAVAAKPDYIEARNNLARIFIAERATAQALDLLKQALAIRETDETKALFVECFKSGPILPNGDEYRDLVLRALVEPWGRPSDVARFATHLVIASGQIAAAVARSEEIWPRRPSLRELLGASELAALCQDRLLGALLESGCVPNQRLERFLTLLRFAVLERATEPTGNDAVSPEELQLYCALARLCFVNDYVFDCTVDESWRASALRQQLVTALQAGAEVPALWPTAVAAYVPLHVLPGQDLLLSRSWPAPIAHLLEQQIGAPQRELEFRASIPRLTPIENDVSLLVTRQYVENPYPRWTKPAPAPALVSFDQYLRRLFPLGSFRPLGKPDGVDLLIAGCGTGRHAVEIAQRLTGARLLAVDLSPMSLGYAKRQSLALDVDNIEFAQADILELASLGRSFDVIEAVGSLQTLADPRAGWKVLSSLLRPGGFIFFGLYSESARRNIVAARDFIARQNYSGRAEDIRRCRQELMDFPNGTALKNVTYTTEFYNTSECRDLLFHVQEHRTTLPEIKADLAAHNLEFIGFEIDSSARRQYAARFPADRAMADLDRWHELETDHPLTFVGMYQFWAQRT